jgi:hypothetical protein
MVGTSPCKEGWRLGLSSIFVSAEDGNGGRCHQLGSSSDGMKGGRQIWRMGRGRHVRKGAQMVGIPVRCMFSST